MSQDQKVSNEYNISCLQNYKYQYIQETCPLSSPKNDIQNNRSDSEDHSRSNNYYRQEYRYFQQLESQEQNKTQLPSLHSIIPSSKPPLQQEKIEHYEQNRRDASDQHPYYLQYYYQQLPLKFHYQMPPPPNVHRPIPRYPYQKPFTASSLSYNIYYQHQSTTTITTSSIPDHIENIKLLSNFPRANITTPHDMNSNNDCRSRRNSSGSGSTATSTDKINKQKGKQRVSKAAQRPRWTDQERSRLLLAVIKEKGLRKMSTFHWNLISRKLHRTQKVCKKQWHQDLLPSFQQLIAEGIHKRTNPATDVSIPSTSSSTILMKKDGKGDDDDYETTDNSTITSS